MKDKSLNDEKKRAFIAELEPETEDTESYETYMKERYKKLQPNQSEVASDELEEMRVSIRNAHQTMNGAKDIKLRYTNELRNYMIKNELNEITLDDGKRITWFNNRLLIPAHANEEKKKI